jgi:nicotinate-nucleotide pyrophosphorylase
LVYAPLERTHYYGFDSKAYQLHNNLKTRLKVCVETQPLRVVTGHYSAHSTHLKTHLQQLGEHQLSYLGSALKFCKIAQGEYEYYPKEASGNIDEKTIVAVAETGVNCISTGAITKNIQAIDLSLRFT